MYFQAYGGGIFFFLVLFWFLSMFSVCWGKEMKLLSSYAFLWSDHPLKQAQRVRITGAELLSLITIGFIDDFTLCAALLLWVSFFFFLPSTCKQLSLSR
jgi:hypothetical protein